ncbi:MAG: hypothetical protein ACFCVE_06385 [Phycisphaerae bacterium]
MTTAGWIIMLFTVMGMTGLLSWCIYRVLATPGSSEHLHSQVDLDPGDREP